MDEPLSSLDAPLRRELRAYLRATLSREGITALHVTHDVEEALELGDEIFIMKAGRILARGKPRAIHENPPDAWCVRFLDLGSLLPVLGLGVMKGFSGFIEVSTPYGRLSCPEAAGESRTARFFIPRGAAVLASVGESETTINLLQATVERVVFQGNFQRLSLRLKASVDTAGRAPAPESGNEGIIELEVDASSSVAAGEMVRIAVNPGKCRILPELS